MSDHPKPGRTPDLPPDLPPEYAETYRRAYEAAYRDLHRSGAEPSTGGTDAQLTFSQSFDTEEQRFAVTGPLFADEAPSRPDRARRDASWPPASQVEPTQALPGLSIMERAAEDAGAPEDLPEHGHRSDARPAWLVPALLALAVVLLLAAAFGIGKAVSHSVDGAQQAAGGSAPTGVSAGGGSPHEASGKPYAGAVQAVPVQGATASCQAPQAVDAAGHPVGYAPVHVFDGDLTTAWRCNGDGVGQKLELRLPAHSRIAEVGLVPGYAKTDPRSGADRYAENDRITKVRWVFNDGTTVTQTFDGSAHRRDMQTKRIPVVRADRVTVEILASTPGPRHTVAISEVHLAGPAS